MTELYIDGVAAVLGKDFNIQVKRENPLFTKNGEYTYDITLPLDNATNAELYGHLNRLNSTQAVSTNRRAVLVADNRVYCNGTEVITGWTEYTVSIQIASGNSELNWFIGADLQISFLDGMPVTPALTEAEVMRVTAASYPDVSYNLPPVYDRTNDAVINPYFADLRQSPGQYCVELDESGNPRDFYPQPYLCAYVRAVLEALNYTVEYLFLESTIYKDLLICHAVRSMKWKDYLPGWSVKDFLEQIELMFNATFLVDNRQRTVRVLSNNAFYAGQETVHVAAVEDTYEAERADEVTIIDAGKCVAHGTPAQLKTRYAGDSLFVYAPRSERLDKLFGSKGGKFDSGRYVFALREPKDAVRLLGALGDDASDFEVIKGTMDDVFLSVTGKRAGEGGDAWV